MTIFEDLPSTNTPINAENLNNNFNEIAFETGTNANGSYIKYTNGLLIVTQRYSQNIETSEWTDWGTMKTAYLNVPPNYPVAFVELWSVTKSAGNTGNNFWLYYREQDYLTRSGTLGIVRPNIAGATVSLTINVIAIGKWK